MSDHVLTLLNLVWHTGCPFTKHYNYLCANKVRKHEAEDPESLDSLEPLKWWKAREQQVKYLALLLKMSALCHCIKCTKWMVIQFSWKSGEREEILSFSRKCQSSSFCMKTWDIELFLPKIVLFINCQKCGGVRVHIILQCSSILQYLKGTICNIENEHIVSALILARLAFSHAWLIVHGTYRPRASALYMCFGRMW